MLKAVITIKSRIRLSYIIPFLLTELVCANSARVAAPLRSYVSLQSELA